MEKRKEHGQKPVRSPQHPFRYEGRFSNFFHSPFSSLRSELRPGAVYEAAPLPSAPRP